MYELLLKGGEVIDPAHGIHARKDIGISQGKIVAVAIDIKRSEGKRVIDAEGKIVTPGLIDLHAHVAGAIMAEVTPDEAGVFSGVTTVCDGGSTGHANFGGFRRFVISEAQTDVLCFLHMCSTGLAARPNEIWSWRNINPEATLSTIAGNRDIIKGIKLRAVEDVVTNLGVEAIKATKKVAAQARLPVMIHIGLNT